MEELNRERYDITEIPLNATMSNVAFAFDANVLIVGQIPIEVQCRINDVGNPSMNLQIFRRIDMRIKRIFLTTTTTSTTSLLIFSSKDVTVETMGFGNRAQLIDSLNVEYDARDIVAATPYYTTTVLGDGATYTGAAIVTTGYNKLTGSVFADRAGTLYIEQSQDGTNYDVRETIAYTASALTFGFSVEVVAPYARVRFTNAAGAANTVFRLYVNLSTGP